MRTPIVIEPENFDVKSAWKGHDDFVDSCGGTVDDDGNVNWGAAFSADPGICSCPICNTFHWAFGVKQKCTECSFIYPVNWYMMYAQGVQHAMRLLKNLNENNEAARYQKCVLETEMQFHEKKMENMYYKYGFENPVNNCYESKNKIDWANVEKLHNLEKTEWAIKFKEECSLQYLEALNAALDPNFSVTIEENNELGYNTFAIIANNIHPYNFWMCSKETKEDAVRFCKLMNWIIKDE